jgi:hypothetical protein
MQVSMRHLLLVEVTRNILVAAAFMLAAASFTVLPFLVVTGVLVVGVALCSAWVWVRAWTPPAHYHMRLCFSRDSWKLIIGECLHDTTNNKQKFEGVAVPRQQGRNDQTHRGNTPDKLIIASGPSLLMLACCSFNHRASESCYNGLSPIRSNFQPHHAALTTNFTMQ